MSKRQPPGGQAPVVQRVRIRYAKRGPLRFTSHRDFARAIERAIHRANVPIAYSQGFTPHPKISFCSAAPTGVASEAEYLELGLREAVEPEQLRTALDSALSPGLDILEAVVSSTPGSLADRITAARWRVEVPGVTLSSLSSAVDAFMAQEEVLVERLTKQGRRNVDARGAVVNMAPYGSEGAPCAILDLVVRQVTPSVRPDDVLSGLSVVAGLESSAPGGFLSCRATRLVQGTLTPQGEIVDPLELDRATPAVNG
ncbi:TIGR03936 family radical SAM-associated protein [Catelliglobosispora koreensis]|uniref:TIGR03936 family radical SAM-associated protein n=1 Tax=Catelliglobosispora koreensis TaxID=129052 RepID=UPI00036F63E9|nr:TIGR03936 family radical SAM-associated protein [Catelliglobosispora koreensis]